MSKGVFAGLSSLAISAVLGTIYKGSSWTNTADFTVNGSGVTATAIAGNLNVSGGSADFSHSVDLTPAGTSYYTGLNRWLVGGTFVVNSVGATTFGTGLGVRSAETTSGQQYSVCGRIDLSNTGTSGTLYVDAYQTSAGGLATAASSASQLSFVAGNTIFLSVERLEDMITVTAYNVTTGSAPISASFEYPFAFGSTFFPHNTGKFAIFQIAGTVSFTNLFVSSGVTLNPDVMIVGDSKSAKFWSGPGGSSFAAMLQNNFRCVNLSCGSDTTADVLLRLPEIVGLRPSSVILEVGCNDARNGILAATTQANYLSIVQALNQIGTSVYHLILPENTGGGGVSQATMSSYIQGLWPANVIASSMSNVGTNAIAADGIHPNPTGHALTYKDIVNSLTLPNRQFNSFLLSKLANAPQSASGSAAGFTTGTGTTMNSGSSSNGSQGSTSYTFGDVVAALKQTGILAR